MRLLLDANLSWRLCAILQEVFDEVDHVDQIDLLPPASDIEIWKWAEARNAVIVTNDDDYYYFSLQKGFPPKVVILRSGNMSTKKVAEILINHRSQIEELGKSTELGLLEIL